MITKISNGRIIVGDNIVVGQNLYLKDGVILFITNNNESFDNEIDAQNLYISPGFIDIHVHGGGGSDFMDGGKEPIINAARFHLIHGTTTLLATTLACSIKVLKEFLNDVVEVIEENSSPNIYGVHMEGPYFSVAQSGAQNPNYIKNPDSDEYTMLLSEGKGFIKRWSFAPELGGSEEFCEFLIKNNIVPSIGHSDAVYEDVKKVYDVGCRSFTHLYSGMSTITREQGFRRLGVIESAFLLDDINAEIIADGKHLPPELLKLIVKHIGRENLVLITDAMRGSGMGDGNSLLGRIDEAMPCIIEDGIAKLCDRSAFAGSVATADRLIKTMVHDVGIYICDAVKMMTENPAKVLGITNKGRIASNYDADIVFFDDEINIKKVMIKGKVIGENV